MSNVVIKNSKIIVIPCPDNTKAYLMFTLQETEPPMWVCQMTAETLADFEDKFK